MSAQVVEGKLIAQSVYDDLTVGSCTSSLRIIPQLEKHVAYRHSLTWEGKRYAARPACPRAPAVCAPLAGDTLVWAMETGPRGSIPAEAESSSAAHEVVTREETLCRTDAKAPLCSL